MNCAHNIIGYQSYKWSTHKIMSHLNILTVHHMITKETILFIHKIIFNNYPTSIYNMITYSINERNNLRSIRKPMIKYNHTSDNVKQSLFYRSIYLYNLLEYDIKCYNPKKLSKNLQKKYQIHISKQ